MSQRGSSWQPLHRREAAAAAARPDVVQLLDDELSRRPLQVWRPLVSVQRAACRLLPLGSVSVLAAAATAAAAASRVECVRRPRVPVAAAAGGWGSQLDPLGYFVIYLDPAASAIVADHYGNLINDKGARAAGLLRRPHAASSASPTHLLPAGSQAWRATRAPAR